MNTRSASYLKGKLAFVMGGSEGIGLAIAEELIKAEANVLIASRSSVKLSSAATSLEEKRRHPQQRIGTLVCDITDQTTFERQLTEAVHAYGLPDFLVNCAGFSYPGYLQDLDMDQIRAMMDVNYFGTVHAVKTLLPAFLKRGQGHIVNVSSMAGFLGLFGYTGYCASKYAVIGFSEALRREVAPFGIRVSVLCPPNTRTPGLDRENQHKPAEVLKAEETVRTLSAGEVAQSLVRALPKNPFLVLPSFDSLWAWRAARWFPPLADYLLKRPLPKPRA